MKTKTALVVIAVQNNALVTVNGKKKGLISKKTIIIKISFGLD